jgi:hypothetical protein
MDSPIESLQQTHIYADEIEALVAESDNIRAKLASHNFILPQRCEACGAILKNQSTKQENGSDDEMADGEGEDARKRKAQEERRHYNGARYVCE